MTKAEQMAQRMAVELKLMCEAKNHETNMINMFGMDTTQRHALELLAEAGLASAHPGKGGCVYRPTMAGYRSYEGQEDDGARRALGDSVRALVEKYAPVVDTADKIVRIAQRLLGG